MSAARPRRRAKTPEHSKRRPQQRLERSTQPSRASDLAVTVVSSVSIALPLLFYLHQHGEMLRYGYEIDSLKERRAQLQERRRQLRAARAEQVELGLVEDRARQLGLIEPEPTDVRSLEDIETAEHRRARLD